MYLTFLSFPGTSTDSGFNESDNDKDTRTCNTSKHTKKVTSDAQLIERIFAVSYPKTCPL